MMPHPPEDRFTGCLVGQCVGDAVGFMVEGCPPAVCRPYADAILLDERDDPVGRGPFILGQYSDDSQLARELMLSYVARGRFDPADYAGRIAALFAGNRVVGGGWATARAAERIAAGVPWQQAGTPPPNAGNGSAMRAGPIGLMFYDAPDRLIAAATDQGRITHADRRCSAGAVAIAGAVALVLREDPIPPAAFLAELAEWAGTVENTVGGALNRLREWIDFPPDEVIDRIVAASQPDFSHVHEGISPFVVESVLWSLYAFLHTPDDYVRAIHTAIIAGGDVDTTAAMTGAIAGARNGLKAIPPALAQRVNDQGNWRATELVALARDVRRLKTGVGDTGA
jgi:ADP-ribosylglycohydrolase